MEQKQKMAEEVKEAQATIGKTLNEAKTDMRKALSKSLNPLFNWEIKQDSPVVSVFKSARMRNTILDLVLLSPERELTFLVKGGEKVKINTEGFEGSYFALYKAVKLASQKLPLVVADHVKKKIQLSADAVRVL